MYRGSDSTGLEIMNPLSAAAFSPCLPKPNPAKRSSLLVSLVSALEKLLPVYRFDTKDGGLLGTLMGPMLACVGRTLFACSRQEVTERLDLADSRKMSPTKTFRQPTENRKKAETSVKVSTWCDRTAAPMLDKQEMVST